MSLFSCIRGNLELKGGIEGGENGRGGEQWGRKMEDKMLMRIEFPCPIGILPLLERISLAMYTRQYLGAVCYVLWYVPLPIPFLSRILPS